MVAEKIKYRTGTMTKSPFDMDDIEYETWEEEGKIETQKYLFSIGQSLVYFVDNQVVIENNDGTIEYIDR